MFCSYSSLCCNLGGCWLGSQRSHICHTRKNLKVHSTPGTPHERKGFWGERGLIELPTHTSASGAEIVPWNTVWTNTVWVLMVLHCGQVKRISASRTNPHLQSAIIWKILTWGPFYLKHGWDYEEDMLIFANPNRTALFDTTQSGDTVKILWDLDGK